jgi:hypothetical protein
VSTFLADHSTIGEDIHREKLAVNNTIGATNFIRWHFGRSLGLGRSLSGRQPLFLLRDPSLDLFTNAAVGAFFPESFNPLNFSSICATSSGVGMAAKFTLPRTSVQYCTDRISGHEARLEGEL